MNFELLPDIGEGLVEGEIVKWFRRRGHGPGEPPPGRGPNRQGGSRDPSPKTGRIVKLFGEPQKVKVHSPLVLLEISGDVPGRREDGRGQAARRSPRRVASWP